MNPNVIASSVLTFIHDNLVATNVIGIAYKNDIADHGDVVNVELDDKKFHAPLTEWASVSFRLDQEGREKSWANLTDEYFEPCAVALAEILDKANLFWMAIRAGHRLGTPGAGFDMPAIGDRKLIVSRKASLDLLKMTRTVPLARGEQASTALGEANLSKDQIWVDNSCPVVTSDQALLRDEGDDEFRVLQRQVIGDMNLMFSDGAAVLACRPLPVITDSERAVAQGVSNYKGLSLRVTIEQRGPDSENKGVSDVVTCDMLFGVGVNPEKTIVIYS